jgi:hypothetical protein
MNAYSARTGWLGCGVVPDAGVVVGVVGSSISGATDRVVFDSPLSVVVGGINVASNNFGNGFGANDPGTGGNAYRGISARNLDVFLNYVESTPYAAVATSIRGGPLPTGDLHRGDSYSFRLQLPEDALPAYRSENGELYWEVVARLDQKLQSDSVKSILIYVLAGSA